MERKNNETNVKHSLNISTLTVIRVFVKFFIIIATLHFVDNFSTMLLIASALFITECYRFLGDYLVTKKVSNFVVGSIISALDGAIIVFLLANLSMLYSDFYFLIYSR